VPIVAFKAVAVSRKCKLQNLQQDCRATEGRLAAESRRAMPCDRRFEGRRDERRRRMAPGKFAPREYIFRYIGSAVKMSTINARATVDRGRMRSGALSVMPRTTVRQAAQHFMAILRMFRNVPAILFGA
jgi:hypothetical protein